VIRSRPSTISATGEAIADGPPDDASKSMSGLGWGGIGLISAGAVLALL